MRPEIEQFRVARNIPYLLHFTRAENLPSILTDGLKPRSEIDAGRCVGLTNDVARHDGRREFNCLSISFPNAPMFFKLRNEHPGTEWPILVVHPVVMAKFRTLFCWKNAATNEISCSKEESLSTLQAFQDLFAERDDHPARADQRLKDCDPTHVQAEILVGETIPPKAIYCVIFPSVPCQKSYEHYVGDRQSIVSDRRGYYGTREYYRRWGYGKDG